MKRILILALLLFSFGPKASVMILQTFDQLVPEENKYERQDDKLFFTDRWFRYPKTAVIVSKKTDDFYPDKVRYLLYIQDPSHIQMGDLADRSGISGVFKRL